MDSDAIPAFLIELEDAFNAAMVSNDVERIGACMTEDWLLITPEVGPLPRARILEVIRSGRLSVTRATPGRGRSTRTKLSACSLTHARYRVRKLTPAGRSPARRSPRRYRTL